MAKLIHGGDIYSAKERIEGEIIDFSANINPMGLPQSVKKALQESVDSFACYPDPLCRDLVHEIAKSERISEDMILCGNGAADLIFRISQAIHPKSALIAVPTFSEYEQALCSCNCKIGHYQLLAKNDFIVTNDILNYITPQTGILFLCNPNNPTGQLINHALLEKILVRCTTCGTLLVVDECFRDFLDNPEANTMKDWIVDFPNLLILRAFTKHFAMAGLRLGYCLCSNFILLDKMRECGQPWSVSIPAQVAGIAALKDQSYLEESHKMLSEEKEYLMSSLKELGIHPIGSKANYIFFHLESDQDFRGELEKSGILIRSCENYQGLGKGYFRIAVKSHTDNQKLIKAIQEFIKPTISDPVVSQTIRVSDNDMEITEEK